MREHEQINVMKTIVMSIQHIGAFAQSDAAYGRAAGAARADTNGAARKARQT